MNRKTPILDHRSSVTPDAIDLKFGTRCSGQKFLSYLLMLLAYLLYYISNSFRAGLRLRGALGPNILRGPIYTHS